MKNIRQYILASIALLMLTACPSDSEQEPQSYTQEITLPSNASEQEVTLNKLHSSIATVENPVSWLTVETQAYSSDSPRIKLRSTDNNVEAERKCNITINASSGDRVILSVTQQGAPEGTGIENLHSSQTDKPAYHRQW